MVQVGWFRPLVTKLLPSTMKRFGTSCARWYLSTTELLGSFPIRQVPMRWQAAVVSSMGNDHFLTAPAAPSNSSDRSRKKLDVLKSSGWLLYVTRNAGSPQVSFASGSRSEEHTSELQSRLHLVCRLLLEKKKKKKKKIKIVIHKNINSQLRQCTIIHHTLNSTHK